MCCSIFLRMNLRMPPMGFLQKQFHPLFVYLNKSNSLFSQRYLRLTSKLNFCFIYICELNHPGTLSIDLPKKMSRFCLSRRAGLNISSAPLMPYIIKLLHPHASHLQENNLHKQVLIYNINAKLSTNRETVLLSTIAHFIS